MFREWLLQPVLTILDKMGQTMTNVSSDLNTLAEQVRGPLFTSVQELIASEAAARQEAADARAELAGVDAENVEESAAAANVREAVNGLAAALTSNPDTPDVDPLPEPTPEV